ncbi:N-acetylmuramoyl-L-alanine amidase [Vannielia sp.]|uniref:N-acetylmuramoyl-L-alanine amidase n=1 Tax=Vannielia sp. TaxID=2813045 RepID=UPI002634DE38|nr:N-acetylmuramoyl-L-alanine amidase [Vannielia sp.]MDF1873934.1 N-acetylmuramoyl-L-alanine amidase [Vannielia sp.]
MQIEQFPTPNMGERRDGALPDSVLLHYTAMGETRAVLEWLATPEAQVSAHYVISPEGAVWQMVPEEMRAWHAGAACWGGCVDVNSRSIGIEIVNTSVEPFAWPQMRAVETLVAAIRERWAVPVERVLGHSDVAPGRKIDPGRRFDWQALARQGLAVWSEAQGTGGADEARFMQDARAFGYRADVPFDTLLEAFRSRFRPAARGGFDATDCARMADLAARYPVDLGAMV